MRTVIYGLHSADWMSALAPDASVWSLIPEVESVVQPGDHLGDLELSAEDVLIPLMERHALTAPAAGRQLLADRETLSMLRNKANFGAWMRDAGLAHLMPDEYADAEHAQFPCVLKRTDLNGGNGIVLATSAEHLTELLQDPIYAGHPVVLQEHVQGPVEYVVFMICKRGRVLWQRTFKHTLAAGHALRTHRTPIKTEMVEPPAELLAACSELMARLKYTGPVNIDCTVKDGRAAIYEANPRLGGTLMLPAMVEHLAEALGVIIESAEVAVPV